METVITVFDAVTSPARKEPATSVISGTILPNAVVHGSACNQVVSWRDGIWKDQFTA